MPKGKITIITEVEYDIDMELYVSAGVNSYEEAIQVDIKSAEEQPAFFLDMKGAKTTVLGEILKEEEKNS